MVVLGTHDLDSMEIQHVLVKAVYSQTYDGSFPQMHDLSLLYLSVPARLGRRANLRPQDPTQTWSWCFSLLKGIYFNWVKAVNLLVCWIRCVGAGKSLKCTWQEVTPCCRTKDPGFKIQLFLPGVSGWICALRVKVRLAEGVGWVLAIPPGPGSAVRRTACTPGPCYSRPRSRIGFS